MRKPEKCCILLAHASQCIIGIHKMQLRCRSSPQSQRRLSDLMMGTDVGEVNVGLEGNLEDMLPPDVADIESMTHPSAHPSRPGEASQCC